MKSNKTQPKQIDFVGKWFKKLESSLQPRFPMEEKFVHMQEQLIAIEKQFRDPDVAEYTYQIYPELLPKQAVLTEPSTTKWRSDERFRKIFHFCNQQMQLMENVFVALQLDKPHNRNHHLNRGWMNLFRRWTKAPFFRASWAVSVGTYSLGYQMFCEDVLNLYIDIKWRPGDKSKLIPDEHNYLKRQIDGKKLSQYRIWVAEMVRITQTKKSESFPIGFAAIRLLRGGEKAILCSTFEITIARCTCLRRWLQSYLMH